MVYACLTQRIICREVNYTFYTKQHPYLAGNFMSHNQNQRFFEWNANRKQNLNLILCPVVHLRQSGATICILHPTCQFMKKQSRIAISVKLK